MIFLGGAGMRIKLVVCVINKKQFNIFFYHLYAKFLWRDMCWILHHEGYKWLVQCNLFMDKLFCITKPIILIIDQAWILKYVYISYFEIEGVALILKFSLTKTEDGWCRVNRVAGTAMWAWHMWLLARGAGCILWLIKRCSVKLAL